MTRREEFRADLKARDEISPIAARARKRLAALNETLQSLSGNGQANRALEQSRKLLDRLGVATEKVTKAEADRQRIRAAGGQAKSIRNAEAELSALERVNRALRNEETRRRAVNRLRSQGLDARARTAEAEAQERITRSVRREAVARAEVAQRKRQGLSISQELLRSAGLLTTQAQAQARAEANVAAEKLRQLTAQREIALRQRDGLAISDRLRRDAAGLAEADERRARSNRSVLFSFRRVATVVAGFAAVRGLGFGFTEAIRGAIGFQSRLEIAELSIQSLLTATSRLRDPFGELVPQSEAFARNQAEARRQIALLRRDSLQTLATFTQLVDTFQVAVAPGRAAGLDIDQIRTVSVRISQVAAAIGLAQNQLAEEIRSILSGTIQLRTTRIAAALGITNEDIRNARAQGQLFEFLEEQFSAFALAGGRARLTLAGLGATLRDLLGQASALAGVGFFNSLREGARTLAEEVFGLGDATSELRPNPAFVAFLKEIFDLFAELVDAAVAFVANINFQEAAGNLRDLLEVFRTIGGVLGSTLTILARFIGLLDSFVQAANSLVGSQFTETLLGAVLAVRLLGATSLVRSVILGLGSIGVAADATAAKMTGFRRVLELVKVSLRGLAVFGLGLLVVDQVTSEINNITAEQRRIIERGRQIDSAVRAVRRASNEAFGASAERLRELREEVGTSIEALLATGELQNSFSRLFNDNVRVAPEGALAAARELERKLFETGIAVAIDLRLPESTATGIIREIQDRISQAQVSLQQIQLENRLDPDGAIGLRGTEEQVRAEQDLVRLRQLQAQLQERIFNLSREVRTQNRIQSIQEGRTTREFGNQVAAATRLVRERQTLTRQLAAEEARLSRTDLTLGEEEAALIREDQLRNQLEQNGAALGALDLTNQQIDLAKELLQTQADLNAAKADEAEVQRQVIELNRQQVRLATQAREAQAFRNRFRQASATEIAEGQATNLTAGLFGSQETQRQAAADAAAAIAELNAQRRLAQQEIAQRILQIQAGRDAGENTQNAERELGSRLRQLEAEEAILEFQARQADIANQRANERADNGLVAGFRQFTEDVGTLQDGLFRVASNFTQILSSGITNAFITALQGGDVAAVLNDLSLQFVQSLIQEGVNQLLSLVIGTFLPSLTSGAGAASATLAAGGVQAATSLNIGGALAGANMVAGAAQAAAILAAARAGGAGLNSGGRAIGGLPSAAHASAPGFDTGGPVGFTGLSTPPPGVSPKDTLAAWLTPGEHVIQTTAVRKYGRSFMDLVNKGRIPATLAKSLSKGVAPSTPSRGPGFNTGGAVSASAQISRPRIRPVSAPNIIVTDEQAMDRQMRGGRDAHQQRMGYNRRAIRASLGIA